MLSSSGFDTWSSTAKRGSVKRNAGKRWHSGVMSSTQGGDPAPRFLTLADVAEILAPPGGPGRGRVQSGELRYIQIGGRQQDRIETVELEKYIQRMYAESD